MTRPWNLLVFALALAPLAAHAGKEERDFVSGTVEPALKDTGANYKKSCGCDVKFDVKYDTFKTVDELRKISYFASTLNEKIGGYCNDAPSKAAMCKVKAIEITKTSNTTLKFSSGKVAITTDGESTPSWEMLIREVDK